MTIKPSVPQIRVAIADDHPIVREGLRRIVMETSDIIIVGEADSGVDTIRLTRATACDVLLLDISLPDRNGIDVLKQLRQELPKLTVLMLSIHPDDQYAIRSLKAGASGYLNKQSSSTDLINAIRQVALGQKYISMQVAQQLASQIGHDHEAPLHATLSDREYQTLTMIASGKTVGEIAEELVLSAKTISMYRSRLLQKMKLRHNAELTHYAIRHKLVNDD